MARRLKKSKLDAAVDRATQRAVVANPGVETFLLTLSNIEQLQIQNHATINPPTRQRKCIMVEPPKLIPEILSVKLEGFEVQQKWMRKVDRMLSAVAVRCKTESRRHKKIRQVPSPPG